MKAKDWAVFILLGLIWGTSFLWIKIALEEISPYTLVAFRLSFGLLGLIVVMALQRQMIPLDRRTIILFVILSIFQTALPFILITWGETRIDSGVASILNGTLPLFTIVLAHFTLADEKITVSRALGLAVGFVGVVMLVSRDMGPQGFAGDVLGQLAVLAAAVSYAIGVIFARKYVRGHKPVVQSTMVLIFAAAQVWVLALAVDRPLVLPALPITWLALAWLGLLGSCLAYLLYFTLINNVGATKAAVVTYVFPVVGLVLGVLIRHEPVDWRLLLGTVLIVFGIVIINVRLRLNRQPQVAPASAGE